jgi:uncharacterized coiled-coil protein SlyX
MSEQLPEHIDQLEQFYQQNLQGYEKQPSVDLWAGIESQLDALDGVSSEATSVSKASWYANPFVLGTVVVVGVMAALLLMRKNINESTDKNINVEQEQVDSVETAPIVKKPIEIKKSVSSTVDESINKTESVESVLKNASIQAPKTIKDSIVEVKTPQVEQTVNESVKDEVQIEELNRKSAEQEKKGATPQQAPKTLYDKLKEQSKSSKKDLFIDKKE